MMLKVISCLVLIALSSMIIMPSDCSAEPEKLSIDRNHWGEELKDDVDYTPTFVTAAILVVGVMIAGFWKYHKSRPHKTEQPKAINLPMDNQSSGYSDCLSRAERKTVPLYSFKIEF